MSTEKPSSERIAEIYTAIQNIHRNLLLLRSMASIDQIQAIDHTQEAVAGLEAEEIHNLRRSFE